MLLTGPELPPRAGLQQQEQAENFPVALRLLPRTSRRHLRAVYDVARTIDDLGDEATGDRTALLTAFGEDLARVWTDGQPQAAVLRRLVPTAHEADLPAEPFRQLLAANLQDQQVSSYDTFEELLAYCALSANPIGRLVLQVFGVTDARCTALSDQVCTALQLLEHWQDVGEDRRAGRTYLPAQELAAHGVDPADLSATASTPQLRALLRAETDRAAALLDSGTSLVPLLHGWARLAVSGYVAGGRATVRALRRPGVDVLVATPRPRRVDVLRELGRLQGRRP